MKKILGATIACSMGLVLACAFAACDSNDSINEAEVADKAIGTVRVKYIDEAAETPSDYEVIGQTIIDKVVYPVTWSVSTTETGYNLSDYVTVGTMNETTKMVTISVNAYTVINYTLTASVTVGSETRTVSFDRHTVATFTVAEAIAEGNKLEKDAYYQGDSSEAQLVLVKGYVVDPGTYNAGRNSIDNVYIVDEYSADKDKTSAGALLVFRMVLDGKYLTQEGDLTKGDLITVQGYIQKYNSTIEVTYKDKVNATCVGLKKAERTDAEKVAAAKAAVKLSATTFYDVTSVNLPSTNNEASLEWSVEGQTSLVNIADGKLNIVSLPDTETSVTIKVTIKSGSVTDTKTITITLVKLGDNDGSEEHPFTVAEAIARASGLADKTYYQVNGENAKVYIKGYVTDAGTLGSYISNMYIADTKGASKNDSLWIYSVNFNDLYVPAGTEINVDDEVVIWGYIEKWGDKLEVTGYNGDFPRFQEHTPVVLTDAEKAAKALAAFVETYDGSNVTGNIKLTSNGVTLTITNSNNTGVIALDGKVNRPEADTEVTLTVKATCGTAETDPATVTVTVKAGANLTGDGTLDNPYTVADIKELLKGVASGGYYGDPAELVHVKGYVVAPGTWSSKNSNYTGVYIVDEYGADKNASSEDALQVYGLQGGTAVTLDATHSLQKGEYIILTGYINNYNGTGQISYNSGKNPTVVQYQGASDAVKVANALAALEEIKITKANAEGVALPRSTVDGVMFTWSGSDATYPVADNKITVAALPSGADAEVTLTLTVTCGDVTETKSVTVIIAKSGTKDEVTLYTLDASIKGKDNGYATAEDVKVGDITWNVEGNATMQPWRFGGKGSVERHLTGKTAITGTVKELTIEFGSNDTATVKEITLNVYAADGTTVVATKEVAYTKGGTATVKAGEDEDWTNCKYELVFNVSCSTSSNQFVSVKTITFKGTAA